MQQARRIAAEAEELEAERAWKRAREAHKEAARLFRLAQSSVDKDDGSALEQLRALSRHHETRAQFCETAEAQMELAKHRSSSAEIVTPVPVVMAPPTRLQDAALEPVSLGDNVAQRTEHAEEQWELWKPLEGLMDRLFPKELFGASPPREARASPDYFGRESNNMLESFYVVPDYQPGNAHDDDADDDGMAAAVLRLTEKESDVLDSVMQGRLLLEDDNAQLRLLVEKLHGQVEKLQSQNAELNNRVQELERQRQTMRESVMNFREELGKSVRLDRSMMQRSASPIASSGLQELLDQEARSVLISPPPDLLPRRSPSPDLHEYIRNLERKVEMQQRKLDDWSKYFRDQQQKQQRNPNK